MSLTCEEALYGGAAGGGKSDALLMGALQYVDEPGYAAMIFRTELARLKLSGGLIPRSHEWLENTPASWSGDDLTWTFPSGARLSFGYLDNPDKKYRYGSSEFQYLGFEELTDFQFSNYDFMRSRVRVPIGMNVPARIRSATNPGGPGHYWVLGYFISDEAKQDLRHGRYKSIYYKDVPRPNGTVDRVAFVPARIKDNPFLDRQDYERRLGRLAPILRERLLNGDWTVTEEGQISPTWFRYWEAEDDHYCLLQSDADGNPTDKVLSRIHPKDCQRVMVVDCAATSEEEKRKRQGKKPSRSVVSCFDFHRMRGWLVWRDVRVHYWSFPELVQNVAEMYDLHKPEWVGIEQEKTGKAVFDVLRRYPLTLLSHEGKDKAARAGLMLNEMKEGKIFMHRYGSWRGDAESELLSWTGHPDDPFDLGDTLAYAENYVNRDGLGHVIALQGGSFLGATGNFQW